MPARGLESRFDRFRRTGDPADLSAVFDETAAEILKVASYLSRDAATAEDLLQRTFLTAIEAAPTWDGSRRLMPWLLGILSNHAKESVRRAARSPDPFRLGSRESEDPVDAASRHEEAGVAGRAMDELPDPARSILLLRFRRGMEPGEIARELGIPPATVRSHLHRGIERVRERVPAGLAAFAGFDLDPRRIAGVRRVVVERASAVGAGMAATVGAGTGNLAIGGVLVGKKSMALAVGLLLLLGAAVFLLSTHGVARDTTNQSRPIAAVESPQRPPTLAPPPRGAGGRLHGDSFAVAAVPAPTTGMLEVRVLAPDGTALPEEPFGLDLGGGSGTLGWRFARTGADGVGRVAGLRPGSVGVYSGRGPYINHEVVVAAGGVTQVEVRLPRGVDVEGVVVDAVGSPVGNAEVWIDLNGGRSYMMPAYARTRGDGGFALKDVEPAASVSASAPGHAPSRGTRLRLGAGKTETVRLVLGGPGASVRGRVVDGGGSPVAGAFVEIGPPTVAPKSPSVETWGAYAHPFVTHSADDGTFAAEGLPGGKTWITVRAPGHGPYREAHDLHVGPPSNEITATLPTGVVIERVVVDAEGSPVEGASIRANASWGFAGAWRTKTDAQGRFRLADLPSEQGDELANLLAHHEERGHAALYARGGGEKTGLLYSTAPIVLQPWIRIRVRVVDERGDPIANRTVFAWAPQTKGRPGGLTGADGRARITVDRQATYEVYVTDPEGGDLQPSSRLRGVQPGKDEVTLTVRERDRPTAKILGRVVAADGPLPDGARVSATSYLGASGVELALDVATGRFGSKLIQPGRYSVILTRPGVQQVPLGLVRVAPMQTLDLGDIPLEPPGSLVVRVHEADALVQAKGWITACGARGRVWARLESDGTARFVGVPPGLYRVLLPAMPSAVRPMAAASGTVTIESGREALFDLTATPGHLRSIRVEGLATDDAPGLSVEVYAEGHEGVIVERVFAEVPREGGPTWTAAFAPGRYVAVAETADGRTATASFEVRSAGEPVVSLSGFR